MCVCVFPVPNHKSQIVNEVGVAVSLSLNTTVLLKRAL